MKIPKDIKGKNRIRDFDICRLYIDGKLPNEIIRLRTLNISVRRVQKILSDNDEFVSRRVGWSKSKRLHRLQRIAEKTSDGLAARNDILSVLEQIRKEVEGDNPAIENHLHITNVTNLHKLAEEYKIDGTESRISVVK